MRRNRLPLLAFLAVAILVLGACSDSDSGSSGSGSGSGSESGSGSGAEVAQADIDALAEQAGLDGKVNVEAQLEASPKNGAIETELDDFYFGPTFVKAEPGSTVKVTLHNEGDVDHTFTIDSANIDEEVSPGKEMEVDVKVPDSGALAFYCRFHRGSGMQGAFLTSTSS